MPVRLDHLEEIPRGRAHERPDVPFGVFVESRNFLRHACVVPIREAYRLETPSRIPSNECATIRAGPEPPSPVFEQREDVLRIRGFTRAKRNGVEHVRLRVEAEQPPFRPDPDEAVAILAKSANDRIRQGTPRCRIARVDHEIVTVESVEPVRRSKPDEPFPVLHHRVDRVVGDPRHIRDAAEAHLTRFDPHTDDERDGEADR